ncbi:MAG: hypothetical protein Fur0017_17380 [Anaerolineales bacterium]
MKQNRTISVILMGALLVTMSACGAQQVPAAEASESEGSATIEEIPSGSGDCANLYLPVIAGATWNYSVTGPTSDTFTRSITSANANGFADQDVYASGVTRQAEWNCKDGNLISLSPGGNAANVTASEVSTELQTTAFLGVTLPATINPGDSWTQSHVLEGTQTIGGESFPLSSNVNSNCTAAGIESITVPAGTFDAMRVDCQMSMDVTISMPELPVSSSLSLSGTTWYAEGVGMVKTSATGGGMDSVTELTSYNIP